MERRLLFLLIKSFVFSLIKDDLSQSSQGTQSFFSVISAYSNDRREWARGIFSGGLAWRCVTAFPMSNTTKKAYFKRVKK